jgi:hypothetical protein
VTQEKKEFMNQYMKIKNAMAIAVISVTAMLQTSQAAFTDSLGHLVSSGGTLSIGDKTFSNFSWFASGVPIAAADLNGQAAGLQVTASVSGGVYYLDYSGLIAVNNLGGATPLLGDLQLRYTVTASPGSITMIDQNYTPNATPGTGQIIIGETVRNSANVIVGNSTLTLNPLDLSDPVAEPGDNLIINPGEHQLNVIKDILIGASPFQLVGLSDVQQSFHQTAVPEPTTVIAGALLLLPFGASTLRSLRKNRKA